MHFPKLFLIKKSLRVFTGNEGTGRTIVPYVLSKYKARQNTNFVLAINSFINAKDLLFVSVI